MIPILRSTLSLEIDGEMAETGYGVGEAEENSVMVCEDVKDLKHLPPMYAVGDDMLTGVYLIGKATLRMMYNGEAEE